MNLLNKNIGFGSLFNYGLIFILLINLYFSLFDLVLIDIIIGISALIIILLIIISLSKYLNGFIKGVLFFIVYSVIINYLLRFMSLSVWPYDFGGVLATESSYFRIPNQDELLNSIFILIYFLIGTTLVLHLLNPLFIKSQKYFDHFIKFLFSKHKLIIKGLLFFISLQIIFSITFDWKMGSEAWKYGWINRIIPMTFFSFLFFFIQISYWKKLSKKYKIYSILVYLGIIFSSLIIGSRSGIYSVFSNFILVLLIINPNMKVSVKNFLGVFLILFLFGSFTWVFGTAIRGGNEVIFSNLVFIEIMIQISQRLGGVGDSFIAITNNWNDCINNPVLKDVMSISNIFPQFVNTLVPGKIFEIDDLYIPAVYLREYVFGFDNSINNGDVWSGFGWFFVKYGYLSFLVFPIMMCFHMIIFKILLKLKGILFYLAFFYLTWVMYDFFIHGSFIISGFYGLINATIIAIFFQIFFKTFTTKIETKK